MKWDDIYEAERIGRKIESGEEVTKEEMMKALLILLIDFKRRMEDL